MNIIYRSAFIILNILCCIYCSEKSQYHTPSDKRPKVDIKPNPAAGLGEVRQEISESRDTEEMSTKNTTLDPSQCHSRSQRINRVLPINRDYNWKDYFINKGEESKWKSHIIALDKILSKYDQNPIYSPSEKELSYMRKVHDQIADHNKYMFNIDNKDIIINNKYALHRGRIKNLIIDEYNRVDYYSRLKILCDDRNPCSYPAIFNRMYNPSYILDSTLKETYRAAFCGGVLYICFILYLQATDRISCEEAYSLFRFFTTVPTFSISDLPSDTSEFNNIRFDSINYNNRDYERLNIREHLDYYFDYYRGIYEKDILEFP